MIPPRTSSTNRDHWRSSARRSTFFGALVLLVACQKSSPALNYARQGATISLRAELDDAQRTGRLTEQLLSQVAQSTLEGELHRSHGPDGATWVRGLTPCALALERELEARAETQDSVGGEAALLLFEKHAWRGAAPKTFKTSQSDAFRALYARSLDESSEERRLLLSDPDERVRSATLEAILLSGAEADRSVLFEVARLDPNPLLRSKALRALGRIGGPRTLEFFLDRLRDPSAAERSAVVEGLTELARTEETAREELHRLAHVERGQLALTLARSLYTSEATPLPGDDSEQKTHSEERRTAALSRLFALASEGTREERRFALQLYPVDAPGYETLLTRAEADTDDQVLLTALVRRMTQKDHQRAAETKLLHWARGVTSPAQQARAALASFGSSQVLPLLRADARHTNPVVRRVAGFGLIRLGDTPSVARLLSDPDRSVRTDLACRYLSRRN